MMKRKKEKKERNLRKQGTCSSKCIIFSAFARRIDTDCVRFRAFFFKKVKIKCEETMLAHGCVVCVCVRARARACVRAGVRLWEGVRKRETDRERGEYV
jgi:hypothetical protein